VMAVPELRCHGVFPGTVLGRFKPFKANADRRHHISKQRHWATNFAAYDAVLRQRGSLTVRITDAAIVAWKTDARTTRGDHSAARNNPARISRSVRVLMASPNGRKSRPVRCWPERIAGRSNVLLAKRHHVRRQIFRNATASIPRMLGSPRHAAYSITHADGLRN
jgi:hypothetical protein